MLHQAADCPVPPSTSITQRLVAFFSLPQYRAYDVALQSSRLWLARR
jgi:hypothetical protein